MKNLIFALLAVGLFASCQNSDKSVDATAAKAKEAMAKPEATTQTLNITAGSKVNWTGKKLAGAHNGFITISEGTVNTSGGKLTGGKFTIDMNSITCLDLAAGQGKEKLEGHLKSPDFFNVGEFPTSTFEITSVSGNQVTGNLTMLGVSKSITIPADIMVSGSSTKVTSPDFQINRTDWGLKYGSASFFDNLKDKAIDDQISLSIMLKAS